MSKIEFTPEGNALILEWSPLPEPNPFLLQKEDRFARLSSMGPRVHDSVTYIIPEGFTIDEQIMEAVKAKLTLTTSLPFTSEVPLDDGNGFDDI